MAKKTNSKQSVKGIVLVLLIVFSFTIYSYFSALKPVGGDTSIVFIVKSGDTMNGVLQELEDEGIIQDSFMAKVYVKINAKNAIKVGGFQLDSSMSTQEVISKLTNPVDSQISVRLIEGSWARDMAIELEKNLGIEAATFIALWNNEDYVKSLVEKYEVLTSEIFKNKKDVKVLLEGYLYPDTYGFSKSMDEKQVTEFILDNTERKYMELADEFKKSDMSVHEIVTLASVVMYEAGDSSNQLMVAGVFHNRLAADMKLQSSVTVCYTLYEFERWEECELFSNQKIDSPYNTYVNIGLPVGPILNPTIEAIKNTINYTEHDYYFFVADVYEGGDGTVYFSKTYEEHDKKVKELRGS